MLSSSWLNLSIILNLMVPFKWKWVHCLVGGFSRSFCAACWPVIIDDDEAVSLWIGSSMHIPFRSWLIRLITIWLKVGAQLHNSTYRNGDGFTFIINPHTTLEVVGIGSEMKHRVGSKIHKFIVSSVCCLSGRLSENSQRWELLRNNHDRWQKGWKTGKFQNKMTAGWGKWFLEDCAGSTLFMHDAS